NILEGTVERQLAEDTRYEIVISRGVHDAAGHPIAATVRVPFTTETASLELDHIRRSLDRGLASRQAGIAKGDRGLPFPQGQVTTVFEADSVMKEGIQRNDQTSTKPKAPLHSSTAYDITDAGS